MIAGFAGLDRPRRVIGIDASAKIDATREQVARIARNTAELIGLGRELRDDEITVLEGWAGDFYGIPVRVDDRRDHADRPARGHDHRPGLRGEVDGRADRPGAAAARSTRTRTVLYVHLGGQPALNAYSGIFDGSFDGTSGNVRGNFAATSTEQGGSFIQPR